MDFENKIAIFDLDDTLSDTFHRDYLYQSLVGKYHEEGRSTDDIDIHDEKYIKFYKLSKHDAPINSIIELAKKVDRAGIDIVILTGRSDVAKEETIDWLDRYDVPYDKLIMRPHKDIRRSHFFKEEKIDKMLHSDFIVFAIDDNKKNIEMFREKGIFSIHVEDQEIISIE